MLEICLVGFGALGALYSFLLERSGKARVTAVCRSNYEVVKSRGIDIRSDKYGSFDAWKPFRVVMTTSEASDRQYDYVVCTAKFIPDLVPTSQVLGSLLTHTSTFVLIQNGIGLHEELRNASPTAVIMSACAWIDATAIDGGKVVKHGRTERLVVGIHLPKELDETVELISETRLRLFVDTLCAGGGHAIMTERIDSERWCKNLWNIGYSVFCTLSRASCATLLSDRWVKYSEAVVRGFMDEAVEIAHATGIPLPNSAIADATHISYLNYAETYALRTDKPSGFIAAHFKPSMLVDLEAARPMEVEGIVGGVVRKGREAGISTPRLDTAYATLLLLQEPLLQAARKKYAA